MSHCGVFFGALGLQRLGYHLENEETIEVRDHMHREKAKGATFFEATEGETVRPMLDVAWAPMLGAFSVLFEEFHEGEHIICDLLLRSSPNELHFPSHTSQ